jgi:hypothetical protein
MSEVKTDRVRGALKRAHTICDHDEAANDTMSTMLTGDLRALLAYIERLEGENARLQEKLRLKIVPAKPVVLEADEALKQEQG